MGLGKRHAGEATPAQYDTWAQNQPETLNSVANNSTQPIWTAEGHASEIRILGLVLMPEEYPTLLYADPFTSEKICKKGIKQRMAAPWGTVNTDATMRWLKPDEFFMTSQRGNGALWNRLRVYKVNPTGAPVGFRLKHSLSRTVGSADYLKLMEGTQYFNFNLGDCDPNSGGTALAADWNSNTMVCGRSSETNPDARWFWLNCTQNPTSGKETKITATYTPTRAMSAGAGSISGTPACTIKLTGWRAGNPIVIGELIFLSGAAGIPAQNFVLSGPDDGKPDYFTFEYKYIGVGDDTIFDDIGGFSFDCVSYCAGLTQTPVDSAYQNIFQLGKGTVIAASCRLTDMAAPLNIQGESVVSQTREPWTWWHWYMAGGSGSGSPLDLNASYRDAYLGKLANGGYAYHMPFRKTQFELTQFCELDYNNLAINDVWWDIEDDSDVNVFSARSTNNGNNDGSTGLGCDCWITTTTHFNWMTDNKWPDADFPPYSYTIWMTALDQLRFAPRVMSNRWHMGSLMRYLVDKGKVAMRYVGPLLKHGGPIVARHFLGGQITDDGIKLLKDAYKIGDAIGGQLKAGGM